MADPGPNEVCEDCAKGPYKPEEEEVDEYDQIINNSGCAAEHYNMQDCYIDNDRKWAACKEEMNAFRQCMASQAANFLFVGYFSCKEMYQL